MTDLGSVFPPRDEWDVLAYDIDEVVNGYRHHRSDGTPPGHNHSPGFRWGWTKRHRDMTREADGFDWIRSRVIDVTRMPQ